MSRYFCDLHMHSCLSPCGDDEATPNNMAGMSVLNGQQIVALTDHNSARNCPAFMAACKRYGLVGVPGMELTTAEDIHLVCLFPELENALAFDEYIQSKRIRFPNRVDIFGHQWVLDAEDNLLYEETDLLPNATMLMVDEAPGAVEMFEGVCYPAHIDRPANGLPTVLGGFPEKPVFPVVEIHDASVAGDVLNRYNLNPESYVVSSDAHRFSDLREAAFSLELDDEPYSSKKVRHSLLEKLRNGL